MTLRIDTIIGIDPGVNGGLAIWRKDKSTETKKMPDDLTELSGYFQYIHEISDNPIIFIEKMQLRPDDMIGGKVFRVQKLLGSFEQLKAIISLSAIPFILVNPMRWQSALHLRGEENETAVMEVFDRLKAKAKKEGRQADVLELNERAIKQVRKKRYQTMAKEFYPNLNITLANCDALLIMHFGRLMNFTNHDWILDNLPQKLHKKFLFQ